jgi:predicted DNA-binding protein YlxM (UPF0122 family)
MKQIICPLCQGKGKIKQPTFGHVYTDEQRKKARKLYAQGMSLREIGKEIGVENPHPQKIKSLIMSKAL